MAKRKKKRTKAYTGQDAAIGTKPVITRVSAVNRSRLGQWLYDRRQLRRPVITTAVILLIVIFVITAILQLFIH